MTAAAAAVDIPFSAPCCLSNASIEAVLPLAPIPIKEDALPPSAPRAAPVTPPAIAPLTPPVPAVPPADADLIIPATPEFAHGPCPDTALATAAPGTAVQPTFKAAAWTVL